MSITITLERPDTDAAMELVEELEAILSKLYPSESRHGYSVEKLIREGVAFYVIRVDGRPAGCGGVQLFGSEYGELKRMFVRPEYRRQGLAKLMLNHLTTHCREHGVKLVRLETGIHQVEAIGLYESMGFKSIGPFSEYRDDPNSRFFEKPI
jgi:putative acetyltransferase